MNNKQKLTGRAWSMPRGLFGGTLVSICITLVMTALITQMIHREQLDWEKVGYGIMLTIITASFTGAAYSSAKIKRIHLAVCFISGVIYFSVLLIITALFFGGQYEAVGVTSLLILAGSMSAVLLKPWSKRAKRRKI